MIGSSMSNARTKALCECSLTRPHFAGKHDDVAGANQLSDRPSNGVGVVDRGRSEVQHQPSMLRREKRGTRSEIPHTIS